MELRHLRYFVILAEELHFSRAAERLGISPPTLTIQIQEIERTLSAKLFARTKRSVALTSAGEIFLAEARNVLVQFARAENVGRRAGRGEIGRIEIGYVGGAAYSGVLQGQTARFMAASWSLASGPGAVNPAMPHISCYQRRAAARRRWGAPCWTTRRIL